MAKYRKKPVVVEAMQWNGRNTCAIQAFGCGIRRIFDGRRLVYLLVPTKKGDTSLHKDDWIIRDVQGEIYPCNSGIFEQAYELAKEKK